MTSSNINYGYTYFEYPTLTKISEQQTYDKIKALKGQIKANIEILLMGEYHYFTQSRLISRNEGKKS